MEKMMFKKIVAGLAKIGLVAACGLFLQESDVLAQRVVTLRGEITQNTVLTPDKRYLLEGGVFVRRGAKLRIKAGTQIFAGPRSFLVIERGAQIMAKGTMTRPVVFTSAQDVGQRRRGDWGGLIINGNAPINNGDANGEADGEGNTGKYGGSNPNDNSGMLRFVRIEFAGFPLTPTNELNGLALQGVGRGTTITNLQITESGDDAIEFFGGTVDVKRLLIVGSMDDGIDWTGGWTGRIQFAIVQQDGAVEANNGIEADNNSENNDLMPRSNPQLFNFTIIGDPSTRTATSIGALLRVGTAATLRNFILMNFKDFGVRVKDQSTLNQLQMGSLSVGNGIFFQNRRGDTEFQNNDSSNAGDLSNTFMNIINADPLLINGTSKDAPVFRPQPMSPALDPMRIAPLPANDPFFERVTFVGGMGPNPDDDWTRGWTSFRRN
jgi:hypothetical protein